MSLSELYIRNENFEILGIIDDATSVIWTERYDECGDFEIYVRKTNKIMSILRYKFVNFACYVTRDDSKMVGFIEEITITTTEEQEQYVIFSGRCALGLLSRRVIANTEDFEDTSVNLILGKLITDNIVSASIEARNINLLTCNSTISGTTSVSKISGNYFGQNLYECATELCRTYDIGIRAVPVYSSQIIYTIGEIEIQFYKGAERTGNSGTRPVIFSKENDNLVESTYKDSTVKYMNAALVLKSGETPSDLTTAFTGGATGIHRGEIFTEIRTNVASQFLKETLIYRGKQELAKYKYMGEMEATASSGGTYEYRTHYNLGDRVVVDFGDGWLYFATVAEVTECLDETGYHLTPKLKY